MAKLKAQAHQRNYHTLDLMYAFLYGEKWWINHGIKCIGI